MWEQLSEEQKIKYKEYCDSKFRKTIVACETGEPLYFDNNGYIIKCNDIVKLLFLINDN